MPGRKVSKYLSTEVIRRVGTICIWVFACVNRNRTKLSRTTTRPSDRIWTDTQNILCQCITISIRRGLWTFLHHVTAITQPRTVLFSNTKNSNNGNILRIIYQYNCYVTPRHLFIYGYPRNLALSCSILHTFRISKQLPST